jgi:hypothetical protein
VDLAQSRLCGQNEQQKDQATEPGQADRSR